MGSRDRRNQPRFDHLELGRQGEDRVSRCYTERGLTVVSRNWRCRQGEIDLVLRDGSLIIFCEVKTRSSTRFGSPLEAVDRRRQGRLRAAGAAFLREHRLSGVKEMRFDVASVIGGRVEIIEAAF